MSNGKRTGLIKKILNIKDTDISLHEVKAIIRSLMVSSSNRHIDVQQLQTDYSSSEGSPIPYANFGYHTLFDFLRSMPDVLMVYGSDENALVQVVTVPSVQHVTQLVQRSRQGKNSYRGRTRRQLNYSEKGQPVDKKPFQVQQSLANGYQNNLKQPKMQHVLNQNQAPKSAKSAVTVVVKKPSEKEDRSIPRRPTCDHTNERLNPWKACFSETDWIEMLNIPEGAMNMSNTIPEPNVALFAIPNKTIMVRILNVLNPNRIWVRFHAHQMSFAKLQDELNLYCNADTTNKWKLSGVHQGLYCAAFWRTSWYRAKVVGPLIGRRVKLYFVDLGMIEFIDRSDVKYLSEVFKSPPVLAIRTSLAYLAPRRHQWSRQESDHLEQMLGNFEEFCACIIDFDKENNSMHVVLQGLKMANVNKTFASQVFATWVGKDLPTDDDFLAYRHRTFNEKYPTFDCIEEGHFPSVGELRCALKRNFDFEQFYAQIPHNSLINIPQQFKMTAARITDIKNSTETRCKEEAEGK